MKSFAIAAFIGAAAAVVPAPYGNHTTTAHASPTKDVRTTKVTEYTTYCPYPTTYIHGQKTYTVTEATTLTVKCPGGCYKPTADHPEAPRETPKCPAPGSTDHQGRYSCNPAHQYPAGQECKFIDGCFFILPPPKKPEENTTVVHMPPPKTETRVLTAYTTYCPQPTTFVHKESTYTVTTATTLTLPCPGGCTVVSTTQPPARTTHAETTAVVPPPKETEHEMPPPKETQSVGIPPIAPRPSVPAETHAPPPAPSTPAETHPVPEQPKPSTYAPPAPSTPAETHPVPEQPKPSTYAPPAPPAPSVSTAFRPSATIPASTTSPAIYTGAASMQTAGALAAAGAMAAFFL